MNYYLLNTGFSFGKLAEATVLELIVIGLFVLGIRQLVKGIRFSKLIKSILNENYTLYQFTKTANDAASRERLVLSTINEIRRLQPNMNYFLLNARVGFEINAFTQKSVIRIALVLIKWLRYPLILVFVGLISIFISIIISNLQAI